MPVEHVVDRLDVDLIKNRSSRLAGRDLRLFDEVASTNGILRELARAGAREGTTVLAEAQTMGRGRLGKTWFSPPGVNLYASVLFRPALAPSAVPLFSFIGSLAVVDAIEREGVDAAIKWPNDVLVDRKKVAGILIESATSGGTVRYVILGVGVNLNVGREALRSALGDEAHAAGSLSEVARHEIDRNAFAATFLDALEKWATVYAEGGADAVLAAWRDHDITGGRRVEVRDADERYEGRALGVDREGALVVKDPRGRRRRVLTGEIRLLD